MLSILRTFPQREFFGLEDWTHVKPITDMMLRSRFAKNAGAQAQEFNNYPFFVRRKVSKKVTGMFRSCRKNSARDAVMPKVQFGQIGQFRHFAV